MNGETGMEKSSFAASSAWERRLNELLQLYGHRNWIVVADAAYPAQSRPGIETLAACAGQIETLHTVRDAIAACRHIAAGVYTDAEIGFVAENDAPGVSAYRRELDTLLAGFERKQLPHEEIIRRLDQAAQTFSVLIVKTEMTIPYTSVFFELGCGYWNAGAEERLRKSMEVA